MNHPDQVYTTYIRTTPEKLWAAITNPEFTRQYWGGFENVSDWKKGSKWEHFGKDDDGTRSVWVFGEVVESVPHKRLVLTWADPERPEDNSQLTFEIEPIEDMVSLIVIHGRFRPGSEMAGKVALGWPRVLSSLKTFLETGKGLNIWAMKCKR